MGTSKSFAEFEKKIRRSADDLKSKSDEQILLASAKKAKTLYLASIRTAVPDLAINAGRRGTKNGAKLGVGYRKIRDGSGYLVFARGPLQLIERDTSAHLIPKDPGGTLTHTAKGRKRSAKSRALREAETKKLYRIGNRVVRGPLKHPGTKGKHPWEKAEKQVLPSVTKTFEKGVDTIMRGVFG